MQIEDFIKIHKEKYTNYCEIVISPDGNPQYAIPSHLIKLEEIWGVPAFEIIEQGPKHIEFLKIIPMSASPMSWLSEATNTVVCWYNAVLFPYGYTEKQVSATKKLIDSGCMSKYLAVDVAAEKTLEEHRGNTDFLNKLYDKRIEMIDTIRKGLCVYDDI